MRLAEELLGARRRLPQLRSPGDRPGRQHRRHPGVLQLDRRHHRAEHDDRPEPAGAGQHRRRRASPSRAPTPAAPASPRSSAGSTRAKRRPGRPAPRRRATRRSPTAPTNSKSGRSTRPATPTPPRRPSAGPSTPPRRRPSIDPSPPALAQHGASELRLLGHRHRRLRRRLVPVPARLEPGGRLGDMHLAEELLGARRRLPQIRSPGDRPGRQHRRHPGVLQLDRRHHRAADLDRLEPAGAGQHGASRASPSRAPTAAAPASPRSSAGSTRARRPPGRPAPRRRATPRSPTAPITSKSGRSTRPATPTPPRRPSAGPSTPPRRSTSIDSSPPALAQHGAAELRLLGHRHRRLRRRLVPVPARLEPGGGLGDCSLAEELLGARRRHP